MKSQLLRYSLASLLTVCTGTMLAQEFGNGADSAEAAPQGFEQAPDGAMTADQVALDEDVKPKPLSAANELNAYAVEKGYKIGWDEEKERILVIESMSFDIKNPEVSSDYIALRKENISALLLRAKASIIKTIYSEMDAERVLRIPGNPIADQIKEENEQFEKQLKASEKQLARLGANLAEAKADKESMSSAELMATISTWFTEAERDNIAAKYDADKKELYANAKADFERAKDEHEALLEKAEQLKGKVNRELNTTMSLNSSMQIHGCTVLQQAEQITEQNGRYKCEIAIIYSWSNERMIASKSVLSGEPLSLKPGKLSITQWLQKKYSNNSLAEWVGPRSYIDSKGNLWFLGIMPAACSTRSSIEDKNIQSAELEARAEVRFAIYADAFTKQDLEKVLQTKDVMTTEGLADESKAYTAYSEMTGERFKKIGVSGEQKLGTFKMKDSTGQDINVVVCGVNASSAKAMKDIQKQMHVMGLEINKTLEFERGRQQRMREQTEASRDNPSARAAGARQADADVMKKAEEKKQEAAQKKSTLKVTPAAPAPAKANGKLQTGTRFAADDDDE